MSLTFRFAVAILGLSLLIPPHVTGAALDIPLVEAAKQGDTRAVLALLDKLDDDDSLDVNTAEADGTTALHWAVRLDSLDVTDLLIAAGADVMAANAFDITPLSLAAVNGNPAMIGIPREDRKTGALSFSVENGLIETLIQKYDLRLINSSRDLVTQQLEPAEGGIVIVAGPDYDSDEILNSPKAQAVSRKRSSSVGLASSSRE